MSTTKPDLSDLELDDLGRVTLPDDALDMIDDCPNTVSAGANGWCYGSTNGTCSNGECGGSTNSQSCTNQSWCGGAVNHRFCVDGPL